MSVLECLYEVSGVGLKGMVFTIFYLSLRKWDI